MGLTKRSSKLHRRSDACLGSIVGCGSGLPVGRNKSGKTLDLRFGKEIPRARERSCWKNGVGEFVEEFTLAGK